MSTSASLSISMNDVDGVTISSSTSGAAAAGAAAAATFFFLLATAFLGDAAFALAAAARGPPEANLRRARGGGGGWAAGAGGGWAVAAVAVVAAADVVETIRGCSIHGLANPHAPSSSNNSVVGAPLRQASLAPAPSTPAHHLSRSTTALLLRRPMRPMLLLPAIPTCR